MLDDEFEHDRGGSGPRRRAVAQSSQAPGVHDGVAAPCNARTSERGRSVHADGTRVTDGALCPAWRRHAEHVDARRNDHSGAGGDDHIAGSSDVLTLTAH